MQAHDEYSHKQKILGMAVGSNRHIRPRSGKPSERLLRSDAADLTECQRDEKSNRTCAITKRNPFY